MASRNPSIYGIRLAVAPLVRRNVLTPREARWLVDHRYRRSFA